MVPSVPTMTSRAAREVMRPMPIFQLKPSGLMAGSIVLPIMPAKLCSRVGRLAVFERQVGQYPER